ncbi:hypothetical protein [Marinobacter sp.]|uniref:hypothetical protein n=1 Tax=Marinobacter sp. TaxID=50741 RepID=UPI003A95DE96
MAVKKVSIKQPETLYSPFSGDSALIGDEANSSDDTLLFIYYGNANAFAYVSDRLLRAIGKSEDELEIEDLLDDARLDDTVVFEADDEWNGLNYFGFAPLAH